MEQLKTDTTLSLKEPELDRYLKPGEQVIWRGQPGKERPAPNNGLAYAVSISIAVCLGVPLLYLIMFRTIDIDIIFWIVFVSLMFVVIIPAILMFITREFAKGREEARKPKIGYILTNERVIILSQQHSGVYKSMFIPLAKPEPIKLIENQGGTGTIAFGRGTGIYGTADPAMSLVNIPNVLQVYQLIQQAQSNLQQRP